jgi:hypothetical protein
VAPPKCAAPPAHPNHVCSNWRCYCSACTRLPVAAAAYVSATAAHTQCTNAQVNAREQIARLIEVMDAHSTSMALKVYCVRTYEDDAEVARILYKTVMGELV